MEKSIQERNKLEETTCKEQRDVKGTDIEGKNEENMKERKQ